MVFLYNFLIFLYSQIIFLASFFKPKARLFWQGRKNNALVWEKIAQESRPVAWFHVASLGEFEQARPLIEALKEKYPHFFILITFFSPSGYEVRKNYAHADAVAYLPMDTAQNAKDFLEKVQPKIAFFIKYEFWYHLLTQSKAQGVAVFSVSAIFRENQFYFHNFLSRNFYKKIFQSFEQIFVQDQNSAQCLEKLGLNAIVTGDTRFDRVAQIVAQSQEIELVRAFCGDTFTLVVGSSWQQDLDVIAQPLNQFGQPLKIIIAPHEISEKNLAYIIQKFPKKNTIRFSQATPQNVAQADILLIDNYGMLTALYRYGHLAYVGGAFGSGLHNVLEPACYGISVIFGKKYHKFREVVELVKLNAVFAIENEKQFADKFEKLYQNVILRKTISQIIHKYIKNNLGATEKIMLFLENFFVQKK